jgi:hypothetical protein
MFQKLKINQKRYDGFLQTASLWNNNDIYGLHQFKIEPRTVKFDIEIDDKLRLGKYIERFVSYQLEQEKNINILCENIQIQKEKITLGELDCILLKDKKPIHLEIIYKFYLFDSSFGKTEIEQFIGPNKKDSLIQKLVKLKEKQLPLLYSKECITYLESINLNIEEMEQKVYFMAQLFVPFSKKNTQLTTLNQDCIVGFYINKLEIEQFNNCKFYIPTKKDWLLIPHQNVDWLNFNQFKENSNEHLERQFSPLCWMKKPNGEMNKFFLIWW